MNKQILIVTHFQTYGFCQALYDFFSENKENVSLFSYDFRRDCRSKVFNTTNENKTKYYRPPSLDVFNKFIGYLIHFLYNLLNIGIYRIKNVNPDFIFISNPLNFISTKIVYRNLKINYICIDFNPGKKKSFYRKLFLCLDQYCSNKSNINICVSPSMIKVKSKLYKLNCDKFRLVPVGISEKEINFIEQKNMDLINLLYLGSISKKYRLDLIISTLKSLNNKFYLNIIGDGQELNNLKNIAIGIQNIKFHGHLFDRKEIVNILNKSHIGFCFVDDKFDDFTKYADITKIKEYIIGGLVVFASKNLQKRYKSFNYPIIYCDINENNPVNLIQKMLEDFENNKKSIKFNKNEITWNYIFKNYLCSYES